MVANSSVGKDDAKTLNDIRMVAGDCLDVAIYFGPSAAAVGMHQRTFGGSNSVYGRPNGRGFTHAKKF